MDKNTAESFDLHAVDSSDDESVDASFESDILLIIHNPRPVMKPMKQRWETAFKQGKSAGEQVHTYDPQTCSKFLPPSLVLEAYSYSFVFFSFHYSMCCLLIKQNKCTI